MAQEQSDDESLSPDDKRMKLVCRVLTLVAGATPINATGPPCGILALIVPSQSHNQQPLTISVWGID